MPYDYAVHSDFLIHWTGKDIDDFYEPKWAESDKSKTDAIPKLNSAYLDRLHSILKYGLWLTEEGETLLQIGDTGVPIPKIPKTCFTELKLSESRTHAKQYGRLGIGVKRPYLFARCGRPLAYYGFRSDAQNDVFMKACAEDLKDKSLLNFFKPMNSRSTLDYDLYGESEWRILFLQELLDKKLLIDPRDSSNREAHDYFNALTHEQQEKLKYLAPLDGWFQVIIYPSLIIKNLAQKDGSRKTWQEIHRIKEDRTDHGNQVEGGNWPMEMDLDACRNF